jgi:hypothetical protein
VVETAARFPDIRARLGEVEPCLPEVDACVVEARRCLPAFRLRLAAIQRFLHEIGPRQQVVWMQRSEIQGLDTQVE